MNREGKRSRRRNQSEVARRSNKDYIKSCGKEPNRRNSRVFVSTEMAKYGVSEMAITDQSAS